MYWNELLDEKITCVGKDSFKNRQVYTLLKKFILDLYYWLYYIKLLIGL